MQEEFKRLLTDTLESNTGIKLDQEKQEQFYKYYEMLIEKNKVMNLTAITEWHEVIAKHFIDSLSIIKVIPDISEKKYMIIDVGTGAGFPGIPLKIAFPNLQIVLLDSLNKRVKFLDEVIVELKLNNITAIHGRAEDFGTDKRHREKYDFCVSRAVANLSTLAEYCMPYVKVGGNFISYKSDKIAEELSEAEGAISKLSGELQPIVSFMISENFEVAGRTFIEIKKLKPLDKKYPRKAGLPSKEPLK